MEKSALSADNGRDVINERSPQYTRPCARFSWNACDEAGKMRQGRNNAKRHNQKDADMLNVFLMEGMS